MRANQRTIKQFTQEDDAVSPVIAVILMVAITVVLAATVYVWVSGFGADGEQAPAASFKVTNCDISGDDVTIKLLSSSKDLDLGDLKFVFYAEQATGYTQGEQLGTEEPSAETWSTGQSKIIAPSGVDFASGDSYSVDIVHTPSGNILGSLDYSC